MVLLLLACNKDLPDDSGSTGNDLEFVDLGPQTTGDTGFTTDEFAIDVPEDATSVLVHCGDFGSSKLGLVWTLTNPDGSALYDGAAGSNPHFKSSSHDDLVPILIPLTPDAPLQSGSYLASIYVDGGAAVTLDCGAVIRKSPLGNSADVTLEFVFVGVDGLDASTAPDDAGMQDVLAEIDRAFATENVSITASYSDFGGDVATYSVVDVSADDYSEFNNLLKLADPTDPRTLVVFMVQDFQTDEGATILGKAGGPPGTAAVGGTSKSGMVVVASDMASDPVYVGRIAAHEAGHFLGLFHTTERDANDTHDPISDTPECPASADTNGNGQMNSSECSGSGSENVMWWTNNSDATSADFSSMQGQILRGNPIAK
ncbi:MAG TPA: M43 family zinc metalloprotease [Myxococcota bacterium]|nr:M43 family zinc metalloprotease [Myxococcota bacterium]